MCWIAWHVDEKYSLEKDVSTIYFGFIPIKGKCCWYI